MTDRPNANAGVFFDPETPWWRRRRGHGSRYLVDVMVSPLVNPRETLVVSGFWRSGTTWLQHALAELRTAKILFEPFHLSVREMDDVFRAAGAPELLTFRRAFCPYAPAELNGALAGLVRKSLRSTVRSRWVRNFKQRANDSISWRRRVVVKFVRANLCMRAIANTFDVPIIHLYRDPRAVIASAVYKTDRMWGNYEPFDLAGQLLGVDDGRIAYFGQWSREIRALHEKPFPIQFAAYWVFIERFLADSFADAPGARVCFVQYEQAARHPDTALPGILDRLGLDYRLPENNKVFRDDSPSTIQRGQTTGERVHGWKKLLSETEINEISALARDFGFADRLVD
jgi:hypothetical protein